MVSLKDGLTSSYIMNNLGHFYTIQSQTQTLIPAIPFFNHFFSAKKEPISILPTLTNP